MPAGFIRLLNIAFSRDRGGDRRVVAGTVVGYFTDPSNICEMSLNLSISSALHKLLDDKPRKPKTISKTQEPYTLVMKVCLFFYVLIQNKEIPTDFLKVQW